MSLTSKVLSRAVSKQPPVPFALNVPLHGLSSYGNTAAYLKAYSQIGWLFAVVSRIASSVSEAEWGLFRQGAKQATEYTNHPLLSLYEAPNPFYTGQELRELTQMYLDLTGEAWWVMNLTRGGRPAEIWPIAPQFMNVVPSKPEFIIGYYYKRGTTRIPLELNEVIQFKLPNPNNLYRGLGPVQALAVDLDTETYAAKWNRNFYQNSARPDAVLESDRNLSDTEYKRLREEWASQHKGVDRAHRVGILEAGLSYKQISLSPQDAEILGQRKLTRDTILGVYGMSQHILGIEETTNRATAESAEYVYAQHVIKPRLRRIQGKLNQLLAPRFGQGIYLDFVDPTPENKEANREDAESGMRAGYMMINEARALMGLDADPKGDVYLWPFSAMPVEPESIGEQVPPQSQEERAVKGLSDEQKDRLGKMFVKRLGPNEKKYQAMLHAYWLKQAKRIITRLRRLGKKQLPPDFWDDWDDPEFWEAEAKLLSDSTDPILLAVLLRAAQDTISDYGFDIEFDPTAPRVRDYIGDKLRKYSTQVTGFTRDMITAELKMAEGAGESIADMVQRIKDWFPEMETYRAERIARTEVVGASNRAALETGLLAGMEYKQWWASMDERTREAHAEAHAQIVAILDAFRVGGEMVMEPGGGSAENSINCRCALLLLTMEDAADWLAGQRQLAIV